MTQIPVYLFTGFLEGGKTRIIQESMEDQRFNSGEKTLLIQCEEGEEELDPTRFWGKNVYLEKIDDPEQLTTDYLMSLQKKHRIDRIVVEYNGMWMLNDFYSAMPEGWIVYQEMMFAEASTFISYNNNMRSLMVDKLKSAEMIVLNRTTPSVNKDEIHKIIRGISRQIAITYDYPDGHVEYDETVDPLPFDIHADVIEIKDRDYALWYRDLSENLNSYDGKTVRFKGIVAKDPKMQGNVLLVGRHVMTCCAADIAYNGLVCNFSSPVPIESKDWIVLTAKIKVEKHKLYRSVGPVLYAVCYEKADPLSGDEAVATFY